MNTFGTLLYEGGGCEWERRMDDRVIRLAKEILLREPKRRPEAEWIQQRADRLAEEEGLQSRADTDRLIYERMYGREPSKTETVKIRYWRTGRHLPSGREEGLMFAKALGLSHSETFFFLRAYMEKSDFMFDELPGPQEEFFSVYEERRALMERMIAEYIAQVPPARIIQLNIPYGRLAAYARHLYCMDAVSATVLNGNGGARCMRNHFQSVNYESEFLRIRRLLGEIPRRTMLRHIFLLGIPYINRRLIDERLRGLGYLPLTEGHTGPGGALTDELIIGFLRLYEDNCAGKDPLTCREWIFDRVYTLDRYFRDAGKEEYRFLYFRSLSAMISGGDE